MRTAGRPALSSTKTRIERAFDADAIRHMKASTEREITVGGPNLAAQAIKAGLVDEYQLFVTPIVVGGGNEALPGGVLVNLALANVRRFENGTVYLNYRTTT